MYESVRGFMRYESDGTGTRDVRARIRVQSALGLTQVGQLVFNYNSANERLEIRSVRVIKPDGTVITAGPDSIQDLSAPIAQEAPIYTDERQKHVTVPGVSVGDVLEYDAMTTVFEPLTPGQFWETWNIVGDAISLDEQVELNIPKDRAIKLKIPTGVTQTVREEGDRRIYHWSASTLDLPSNSVPQTQAFRFDFVKMLEGAQPPKARQILFSSFQSWDDVARWYEGLERDRRAVTPGIRAQADEIVKGQSSDLEKAEALYRWVSANIRYVSLSFGVGRYQPHAAADILANRYGDCKDKATLLASLMAAEGLHADTVLINSKNDIDPDVPSPLQFDHAITFLALDGKDDWLDSTIGVGPFGYLLPQLRGKNALVVAPEAASALRKTPNTLAIQTLYHAEVKLEEAGPGKQRVHLSFDTRGDLEVLLRLGLMRMPPDQMAAAVRQGMTSANPNNSDATLEGLKTSDPTDTAAPFHFELSVLGSSTPPSGSTGPSSRAASFPFANSDLEAILRYVLPSADEASAKDAKPVELQGPEEFSIDVSGPVSLDAMPKPVHDRFTTDFATFENDMEWKDKFFHGSWRLVLNSAEVPASKADEYRTFRSNVVDSLGSGLSEAEHLPPAEAQRLYTSAEESLERRDWADGAAGMAAALKVDPQYGYAWYELGRARMNMGQYANAEIAYRKYLELEPKNRLANQGLAWVLAVEGKYSDAVTLLEPFLAENPNDADMQVRLGSDYLDLKEYDKAAATFEKAAALEPKNASTQVMLGRAYLGAGQNDKGVAAFQKAVSLDDTPLTLNNAAYYMGDQKVKMDLARQWSARSIQQIEDKLNDLTLQTIQSSNGQLTLELAEYWDTMAWIEYRDGHLPAAEKYARAAWGLANATALSAHLGRIYQAEGLNAQAITAFAQTLALAPKTRQPNAEEQEARKQLDILVGSEAAADDRIKEETPNLETRRDVQVPNSAKVQGTGQFILIVGPGSAITDIESASPDNTVAGLIDAVRAVKLLQTFPDDTLHRLPEAGTLVCSAADQPCTFTPLPPIPSSRIFPVSPAPTNN